MKKSTKKNQLSRVAQLLCGAFLLSLMIFLKGEGAKASLSYYDVCFQQACFGVETAITPDERKMGLMFREKLESKTGMLFVFETAKPYPIWMKNMKIPLDIVWLDQGRRIVAVRENVPPCEKPPCPIYEPETSAGYVLEINAGEIQRSGLKPGDVMTLQPAVVPRIAGN